MKIKKISFILSILVFGLVMFTDVKTDASSSENNDIRLENVEALACYTVIGSPWADACCPPWYNFCVSIAGVVLDGNAINYPD